MRASTSLASLTAIGEEAPRVMSGRMNEMSLNCILKIGGCCFVVVVLVMVCLLLLCFGS